MKRERRKKENPKGDRGKESYHRQPAEVEKNEKYKNKIVIIIIIKETLLEYSRYSFLALAFVGYPFRTHLHTQAKAEPDLHSMPLYDP